MTLPEMSQDEFCVFCRRQIQEAIRLTLMMVIEAEMTAVVGAGPYECSAGRKVGTMGRTYVTC